MYQRLYTMIFLSYFTIFYQDIKGQDLSNGSNAIASQILNLRKVELVRPQRVCRDTIPKTRCQTLRRLFACTKQYERMKIFCPRTCGFCPPWPCIDRSPHCSDWSMDGGCYVYPHKLAFRCARTCGFCGAKTPCDNIQCPRKQRCKLDLRGRPYCACSLKCRKEKKSGPVCATNGKTYENLCELFKDECKVGDFITVKHYGQCIKYEPCRDNADSPGSGNKICEGMRSTGACSTNKELMQFYCAKTCRLCRQLAPSPSCSTSKFGCCWNKDVPATGKHAQGCGGCKDKPLCTYFKSVCGKSTNVNFMRKYCPVSCHYCITQEQILRGYR